MSEADMREIGVGMLGYGFMGRAHSNAFRKIAYHLLRPIAEDSELAPRGGTFEDGCRAAEVGDPILRSARRGSEGTSPADCPA